MRTDLDKSRESGWEKSSNFVRQQGAEEVIRRRTETDSTRKRTDRNRPSRNTKRDRDRDIKILIIAGVTVLLVVILIFTAGKSWQRRTDKKEIELLSQTNADLQTQVQELTQSNEELQNTISSIQTEQKNTTTTTGNSSGQTHALQEAYNFREEASTDADVLAELDEGTTITILKVQDDGWVQAQYNGQTGYIKCGDELDTSASSNTSGTSSTSGNSNESGDSGVSDASNNTDSEEAGSEA